MAGKDHIDSNRTLNHHYGYLASCVTGGGVPLPVAGTVIDFAGVDWEMRRAETCASVPSGVPITAVNAYWLLKVRLSRCFSHQKSGKVSKKLGMTHNLKAPSKLPYTTKNTKPTLWPLSGNTNS
jgi:hypothetical protein